MKLSDLEPKTVYLACRSDGVFKSHYPSSHRYVCTRDEVETVDRRQHGRSGGRTVRVPLMFPVSGLPNEYTGSGLRTTQSSEEFPGSSIGYRVCSLDEWPAKLVELQIEQTRKRQQAQEKEATRERHVEQAHQWRNLLVARGLKHSYANDLTLIGFTPDQLWALCDHVAEHGGIENGGSGRVDR